MPPTLGEIAYNAYCEARDWTGFRGDPLPQWDEVKEEIQNAWEVSANALAEHILKNGQTEICNASNNSRLDEKPVVSRVGEVVI